MTVTSLTSDSIKKALAECRELGKIAFLEKYGFGESKAYTLIVDGEEFDPKAIAAVAYGLDHPNAAPLRSSDLQSNRPLRKALTGAGFPVTRKTHPESREIADTIQAILGRYAEDRHSTQFSGSVASAQEVTRLRDLLHYSDLVLERPTLTVKSSYGAGNWAAVPWCAFLDSREGGDVKKGAYPVFLFREDMSGVYLCVSLGVTEVSQQGMNALQTVARRYAEEITQTAGEDLREAGFTLGASPQLGEGGLARKYAMATAAHKFYPRDAVPDDDQLFADIDSALDAVDAYIVERSSEPPVNDANQDEADVADEIRSLVSDFTDAVTSSGLKFPTQQAVIRPTAFMAAVIAKPFLILTGMSGSGKTQLALRLGEWCGADRMLLTAVRPDWTGPESLFGYEDALRPPVEGRPVWNVPETLRFLLAAAANPDLPHVLILDEMNLAHVERYFSDYLSGLESAQPVLPNLTETELGWRIVDRAEPLLPLPRNVIVIGTVNVDETTYQFSPKVLDRATTFEVRTQTAELATLPARPKPITMSDPQKLTRLVSLIRSHDWHENAEQRDALAADLRALHALLTQSGDEFGHRVFYEGLRLGAALELAGVAQRDVVLDQIVLLKILPRLHGSRRRIEPVLQALIEHASGGTTATTVRLPQTLDKLQRMLATVQMNQFVSFTD